MLDSDRSFLLSNSQNQGNKEVNAAVNLKMEWSDSPFVAVTANE